jgi:hypothetical protein
MNSSLKTFLLAMVSTLGVGVAVFGGYSLWKRVTEPPPDKYRTEMRALIADAREGVRMIRMSASPKDLTEMRERIVKRAVGMPPVSKDLTEGTEVFDQSLQLICKYATLARDFKVNQLKADYDYSDSERERIRVVSTKTADGWERVLNGLEDLLNTTSQKKAD